MKEVYNIMRGTLIILSLLLGLSDSSQGPYRYLSTPKDLHADVICNGQLSDQCDVNLTWPEVHYKKSWKPLLYIIKRESSSDSISITEEAGDNTYLVKGLEKDQTFIFTVKAKQGWLLSDWSSALHVTTSTPPVSHRGDNEDDDAKYPKPRGLKVKFISPIGFKLKWRDPKDAKTLQVKGYRVTWKLKKGQTQKSKVITRRSYSVKGLTAESTYLFRVQTVYASKVSKSLSLFCKTQKELGVLSPSNFKAKAIGTTKIRLTWTPQKKPTVKLAGYKIQYKRRGVRQGDLCSAVASSWKSNYVITDLIKGEFYKVRIAAYTRYTTGAFTPWVLVKLLGERNNALGAVNTSAIETVSRSPEELFNLRIKQISGGVNITWNAISSEVVTYLVEITQDSQKLYIREIYGDPIALEVYSLDPGQEFNVTISIQGVSSINEASVTTSFTTPVPVTVVTEGDHVTLVGGNVTLRCIVQGTPRPRYEWVLGQGFAHYDVTRFEEDSFDKYLLLLELYNVPEGVQNPKCHAQNALENVTKEHSISVIGPIPSPVVHVTARAMTSRKVVVEWETSIEHDYLNVTYIVSIADATGRYRREEEVAFNRCVIRNLTESTEYRVYVVAVTPEGLRSSESDVISFETEKSLPQPTLRTLFWNDTVIALSWFTNSTEAPDLFKVFYKRQIDTDFRIRKAFPPTSTMLLQDLREHSTYDIKVVAVYGRYDVASDVITVETNAESFFMENRRPAPPADAFLMVNKTSMTIRWLPPHPEYRTHIRQYRLDIHQGGVLQRHLTDNRGRNYTLTPFDDTQEATVYLTAVNNAGASDPILRIYKPIADDEDEKLKGAVGNLRGKPLSSNSILLEWDPPTNKRLARFLLRYRPLEYNDSNIVDKWLGPSYNNYVLTGLSGQESYFISIIPYFNEEVGKDSSIVVRTLAGAPVATPQNLTVEKVNFTEIALYWSPPPDPPRTGAITEYVVGYRTADNARDSVQYSNDTKVILRDLLPDTTYYVRVAALTFNETGPYTTWLTATTLPLPVVKEPPATPINFTTKQVPYGITLYWQRPNRLEVPVNGYIVGHGRFIPEVYREILGADKTQYTIHKLRQNHAYIVSVRAFNNFGESEPVIAVAKAGDGKMTIVPMIDIDDDKSDAHIQFDDAPQNVSLELNYREIPTVNVRWFPPAQLQGQLLGYNVYYKKQDEKRWTVMFADRTTFLVLRNLSFDSTYYVRVNVHYSDDIKAKLSRTAVIKTFSLEDTIHALPTPSITSVFSGTNFLDVNWKPPLKDYLHVIVGFILGFGTQKPNENQEFISASQRSFRIQDLKPNTTYLISLAMFNEHGESAKSIVNATTSGL